MKEENEQKRLATMLDWMMPELVWFHVPNGGSRKKNEAIKFKKMGVKAGVHDIFILHPIGRSHGLFIEMKVGDGKLSKEQIAFSKRANSLGYPCVVCYSADEAFDVIEQYVAGKDFLSVQPL